MAIETQNLPHSQLDRLIDRAFGDPSLATDSEDPFKYGPFPGHLAHRLVRSVFDKSKRAKLGDYASLMWSARACVSVSSQRVGVEKQREVHMYLAPANRRGNYLRYSYISDLDGPDHVVLSELSSLDIEDPDSYVSAFGREATPEDIDILEETLSEQYRNSLKLVE
jgi:hypothetical protein